MSKTETPGISLEDEMLFDDVTQMLGDVTDPEDGSDGNKNEPGGGPSDDDPDPSDGSKNNTGDDPDPSDPDPEDPEDPEKDPEEPEDPEDPEDPEEPEDTSSPLIPYAKMLVEEGILPGFNIDEFDGTADGLKDAMNKEIAANINHYKESLPKPVKDLIDGYEEGVPFDKILKLKSEQIEVQNITEDKLSEDINLQKNVLRKYYEETTSFSKEKITSMISKLDDYGDLESEAISSLSELKEIAADKEEQAKKDAQVAKEEADRRYKEAIQQATEYIDEAKEIVPGLKLNKNMREKLKTNITVPVGYDANGNPVSKLTAHLSKDPIKSEIMLNYLFEVTNGFKDFSAFGKPAKSKVLSDLEKAAKSLDQNKQSKSRKKGSSASANEFFKAIEGMGL